MMLVGFGHPVVHGPLSNELALCVFIVLQYPSSLYYSVVRSFWTPCSTCSHIQRVCTVFRADHYFVVYTSEYLCRVQQSVYYSVVRSFWTPCCTWSIIQRVSTVCLHCALNTLFLLLQYPSSLYYSVVRSFWTPCCTWSHIQRVCTVFRADHYFVVYTSEYLCRVQQSVYYSVVRSFWTPCCTWSHIQRVCTVFRADRYFVVYTSEYLCRVQQSVYYSVVRSSLNHPMDSNLTYAAPTTRYPTKYSLTATIQPSHLWSSYSPSSMPWCKKEGSMENLAGISPTILMNLTFECAWLCLIPTWLSLW